jgi:uncharacterized protein (TIGR00369 family)
MPPHEDHLQSLRQLNQLAAFNRWCGIEVLEAESGRAVIAMDWRPEAGQYVGFMHAGVVGALIDTACGFAAATMLGQNLLASHYSVNCLRPAVGERLTARASGEARPHAGVYRVRTLCKRQRQGIAGGYR